MPVPFGIFVPQGWRLDLVGIPDPIEQYETMTRVGQVAEAAGFDSIWLYDHFHTVPTIEHETTFECWMSTAGLARDTSRIKIGQMVTCNGYRQPSLLAKMASTVDVMSHGRLIFGLGAGWYEHEWRAYGYGFPELGDRMGGGREGGGRRPRDRGGWRRREWRAGRFACRSTPLWRNRSGETARGSIGIDR